MLTGAYTYQGKYNVNPCPHVLLNMMMRAPAQPTKSDLITLYLQVTLFISCHV